MTLLGGVEKHGLNFDRIQAKYGARLGNRKADTLKSNFRNHHPDKLKELRAIIPYTGAWDKKKKKKKKGGLSPPWTTEEDTALFEGVDEHGLNFDRIKAEYGARVGRRSANLLYNHFRKRQPDKFKELRAATPK